MRDSHKELRVAVFRWRLGVHLFECCGHKHVLWQVSDCICDLIRPWAWLESLLKLVLLHLCAEADCRSVDASTGFVLSRSREQVSLADPKVSSETCADYMSHVDVVERSDICLVLAWSWHVEVFVPTAPDLDSHVELRVRLRLLKLPHQIVGRRRRRKEARRLDIIACPRSNLDGLLSVRRIDRVVALGSHWG